MGIVKTNAGVTSSDGDPASGGAEFLGVVQEQCAEILEQIKAMGEQLSRLALREAQLRAVLEGNVELERYEAHLVKALGDKTNPTQVSDAIERAALHLEPFPFTVIDNLLPAALYKCLVRGIPPVELFGDTPGNKQHLGVPFSLAPAYSQRVWRYMAEVLIPEVITPRVVDKFRAQIDDWISLNWPGLPPSSVALRGSDGRIMLRRRGYRIPPHRDPKWGFITCILYLARKQDSDAWGTQLYAVEEDQDATNAAPYWIDPQRCTQVADVTFVPNRMLVFLNSRGAHGAQIPADAEPENLERYIYQFRIGPNAETITMLRSMLPEDQQRFWVGKASVDY